MQDSIPWERPAHCRSFLLPRVYLHIACFEMFHVQSRRAHIQGKKFHKVRANPLTL